MGWMNKALWQMRDTKKTLIWPLTGLFSPGCWWKSSGSRSGQIIVHLKDTGRALFSYWTDRLSLTSGHTGELRCWPIKCYKAINQSTCFVCFFLVTPRGAYHRNISTSYIVVQAISPWPSHRSVDVSFADIRWNVRRPTATQAQNVWHQQLHTHEMSDNNSYTRKPRV